MRAVMWGGAGMALVAALLAGCSGTNTGGTSSVTLSGEALQAAPGNLCAVQGTATNVGNLTVNVTIGYTALNASGTVIGTSQAAFQIAPFSSFDYGPLKLNNQTQPSSGAFSNGLACGGISSFKRILLDIS